MFSLNNLLNKNTKEKYTTYGLIENSETTSPPLLIMCGDSQGQIYATSEIIQITCC